MKRGILLFSLIIFSYCLKAQSFEKISMEALMERLQQSTKPVVLNIWATWCAPCVEELPYLNEGVQSFQQDSVELWLLSLDFKRSLEDRYPSFIEKNPYKATHFWLTDISADEFCPLIDPKWDGNIPVTLFYNPKNQYRKFLNRALTKAQVTLEIQQMLSN